MNFEVICAVCTHFADWNLFYIDNYIFYSNCNLIVVKIKRYREVFVCMEALPNSPLWKKSSLCSTIYWLLFNQQGPMVPFEKYGSLSLNYILKTHDIQTFKYKLIYPPPKWREREIIFIWSCDFMFLVNVFLVCPIFWIKFMFIYAIKVY